ncbi:hypothetical protein Tco_1434985, partial [Tanacetum coccineum]
TEEHIEGTEEKAESTDGHKKLESEEDSIMALELIKLIKKILAELEPEGKD